MNANTEMSEKWDFLVDQEEQSARLDTYLASRLSQFSRTVLRRAITAGNVTVDGERAKPAYRVNAGQRIHVDHFEVPKDAPEPENIPLEILHEDDNLVVINKPAGMVVHPAKGHWAGTLASALAYHFSQLSSVGGPLRPGIVHRLDRDTTGIILVAKNDLVHMHLSRQFELRQVQKRYVALVRGVPDRDCDIIEQPIGIHPYHRDKMAIRANHKTSREAVTQYEVVERFAAGYSLIRVFPKTGRTHQIRVHLAHIGCPVLCDRLYAGHSQITHADLVRGGDESRVLLDRQSLHAERVKLTHPVTGMPLVMSCPIPDDMQAAIDALRS